VDFENNYEKNNKDRTILAIAAKSSAWIQVSGDIRFMWIFIRVGSQNFYENFRQI